MEMSRRRKAANPFRYIFGSRRARRTQTLPMPTTKPETRSLRVVVRETLARAADSTVSKPSLTSREARPLPPSVQTVWVNGGAGEVAQAVEPIGTPTIA